VLEKAVEEHCSSITAGAQRFRLSEFTVPVC
jgi:hypothetical protein